MHGTARVCEGCGVEISQARLEAVRRARRCVDCQREVEQSPKRRADPNAFGAAPREASHSIEIDGALVKLGGWSGGLMEIAQTKVAVRNLVGDGKYGEARALVQAMPEEAQAALVAMNDDPEQMLSLTAMDDSGKPAYKTGVVSLLPTETIAGLVAVRPEEKVYNVSLIKAMTPQTFRRAVEDTLDPIDNQVARARVSWQWLESVAVLDDIEHAATLLHETETELIEDALVDRLKRCDLNKVMGGVHVFRFFSEEGAGAVLPSRFIGGHVGEVLDALYGVAPSVMQLVLRRAWDRSAGNDDLVEAKGKVEDEDGDPEVAEDQDVSLWSRSAGRIE